MKSLSSIGLGLSVVFGCLLLALVAELYYLLWWKRRFIGRDIENDYSNPTRDFLYMFCCKNPSSCSSSMNTSNNIIHQEMRTNSTSLVEGIQNKDLWVKPTSMNGSYSNECDYFGQNPRFLFTIVEETKEDLESEDDKSAKSRKGSRNLSDLFLNIETPYMTPLGSPSFFVTPPPHHPPITPLMRPPTSSPPPSSSSTCSYNPSHGFNPLFESSTDAEFNRIKSSPPPKFKFLQDAEEKLYRRKKLMEEVSEKKIANGYSQENSGVPANFGKEEGEEEEGSFITIIVDRNNKEKASSSQVIPLASSPSTFSDHHQQQQQQPPRMISKFP